MGESPRIVIVMGSDSDLPIVEPAVEVLERLGIGFESWPGRPSPAAWRC
jgi:phosphoribosylcarboxyaminoimidazole (NCAIR) mutase